MNLVGQIFHVTRWAISIVFIGFVTGVTAILFPPMAAIVLVALVGVILLWAVPELRVVPERSLRTMFFMMVVVLLCVPAYYTISTGVLPWISLRRLFSFAVIVLFSLAIAGSKSARDKIVETVRANRWLAFSTFGFLTMMFISTIISANIPVSLNQFVDVILNWYVPIFACILIVRSEEDIILLLKIIAIAGIVVTLAGAAEFVLQRRYYLDMFPQAMVASIMDGNPSLAGAYYRADFRNELYRTSSIFVVSLSFGEFAAMLAPISAYFVLHGRDWREWSLGIVTGICSLVALLCSGSRGAYQATLVAMPTMVFLWTIRYAKLNPHSLVGVIMGAVFALGVVNVLALVMFWTRLRNMVIGAGEDPLGNDSRAVQWDLAWPKILSNPILGHGGGQSGDVIGFHNPGGQVSVDSYVLTLLVDFGIPGFLLFFSMIVIGIWIGVRLYLTDADRRAALGGPIACSLIAFAYYRVALSQTENHTLMFLIIGLVFAIWKLSFDRVAEKGLTEFPKNRSSHWHAVSQKGQPTRRS